MRIARILALTSALALCWGCDSSGGGDQELTVQGTTPRLTPSTEARLMLAVQWLTGDNGAEDGAATAVAVPLTPDLQVRFNLPVAPPTRYYADFDALRALPPCPPPTMGMTCTPEVPIRGRGKLAIAVVTVFEDLDGNGRWTRMPTREPVRAFAPTFLWYAQDLDSQAIAELGKFMLLNPQALQPGFNFARIRCKKDVVWPGSFDPFEIVPPAPLQVETEEALNAAGTCLNWS